MNEKGFEANAGTPLAELLSVYTVPQEDTVYTDNRKARG
jgi:hypothetical protein